MNYLISLLYKNNNNKNKNHSSCKKQKLIIYKVHLPFKKIYF